MLLRDHSSDPLDEPLVRVIALVGEPDACAQPQTARVLARNDGADDQGPFTLSDIRQERFEQVAAKRHRVDGPERMHGPERGPASQFMRPDAGIVLARVARRATLSYMTQPLSLRLPESTLQRLGSRARSRGVPPRSLAQRYVEEGIRTDEHPLIRFADGPAGRRARLQGTGLDVWEAFAVVLDNDGDERAAADYLELPLGLIQAAIAYYGVYPSEIDDWIELNARDSEAARSAWLAGQAALKR